MGLALAIIGAAASVVLAGIGSVLGVGMCGEAGAGVTSQKSEIFGKVLLLQALPATQGIYGFLGCFWVLLKVGLLSGNPAPISTMVGWQIFFACLPVALGGLISAIYQGRVSVAGLHMIVKDESNAGKGVIMAAMVETYAVLGLLATILLINGIKVG
ncbi:MAG: V-type H+-transporting ATPase subunit K [Parcubacteria group bacterium LiPW_72]|nr:MAG: V-type H+-transporting ATPase subunit K [Parcubacteria group bacterium LiPW_72]